MSETANDLGLVGADNREPLQALELVETPEGSGEVGKSDLQPSEAVLIGIDRSFPRLVKHYCLRKLFLTFSREMSSSGLSRLSLAGLHLWQQLYQLKTSWTHPQFPQPTQVSPSLGILGRDPTCGALFMEGSGSQIRLLIRIT